MRKKITTLIALASLVAASTVYACNITIGGPCHTGTSYTHDISCAMLNDGIWYMVPFSVTDTTGDGNRIISCGTADWACFDKVDGEVGSLG